MREFQIKHGSSRYGMVLSAVLLTAFSKPVCADVTLVVQQAASVGQETPVPQSVKLLFRNNNTRVELPSGAVLLYAGSGGIIHTLDPARKTYSTTFVPEIEQAGDPLPQGVGVDLAEDVKFDLKQTKQTKIISGVTARQYLLTGTVTVTGAEPPPPDFSDNTGGFPLRLMQYGVREDGARMYLAKPGRPPAVPQISLSGEIWLSDGLKVSAPQNALALAQLIAPNSGPLLKSLADELSKHKAVLLLARVTMMRTFALPTAPARDRRPGNDAPADKPGENGTASHPPPPVVPAPVTTVITLTLQSFAAASLSDALFQTPADYNLVGGPPVPFILGAPVNSYGL